MTYRERKEARLQKRLEWAESRRRKAEAKFSTAHNATEGIPFGQPILVGHHSERRHRKALERQDNAMRAACESLDMAKHHESVAGGISDQLETSIFSDDVDAIDRLKERIAEREAERDRMKAINREIRKGKGWCERITPPLTESEKKDIERCARFNGFLGYPSYSLQNIGANIRRDKQRLARLEK